MNAGNDSPALARVDLREMLQDLGYEDTGDTSKTTTTGEASKIPIIDSEGVLQLQGLNVDGFISSKSDNYAYGVRIDKTNQDSELRVTYIGKAVGFDPIRGNDGTTDMGDWSGILDEWGIAPCVLQNDGGGDASVNYYLDPDNFALKSDGVTASTLDGTDGDVMIRIPLLYYKFTNEGDSFKVEVDSAPFAGAVRYAHDIEDGYNQVPMVSLVLLQAIMVILLKSTNTQDALGLGLTDSASYAATGGTNASGMFYGTDSIEQMKFLGIEDFWGNKSWWIDGCYYDNRNIYIGMGSFNDTGVGYSNEGQYADSDLDGYIRSVKGGNKTAFIPTITDASSSTYFSDYGYVADGRLPDFGGNRAYTAFAGGFCLSSSTAASSTAAIGSRLCFRDEDALYIGAYLGTTDSGNLRSISGTAEPTGSKTIGAFRTEAQANNV